jgi:hypothetical protein
MSEMAFMDEIGGGGAKLLKQGRQLPGPWFRDTIQWSGVRG